MRSKEESTGRRACMGWERKAAGRRPGDARGLLARWRTLPAVQLSCLIEQATHLHDAVEVAGDLDAAVERVAHQVVELQGGGVTRRKE